MSSISAAEQFAYIHDSIHEVLTENFRPIIEVMSNLPEGQFTPQQIREIFVIMLQNLEALDPAWAGWTASNPENKSMLSVVSSKKQIEIPDGRSPIASKQKLLAVAMHEIGVHAQRAVNGEKLAPDMLDRGLSGYIDFEEGLGVLFEVVANNGEVPEKIKDRYMDIALAKGLINDTVYSRQQIIQLGIERAVARHNAANGSTEPDLQAITKEVNDHVNRIFRGGTGEVLHTKSGNQVQAVYSKDSVYYGGYLQALNFIYGQAIVGKPLKEVIDFLLQGKFDATNEAHVAFVHSKLNAK